jgi:hypothetical protein
MLIEVELGKFYVGMRGKLVHSQFILHLNGYGNPHANKSTRFSIGFYLKIGSIPEKEYVFRVIQPCDLHLSERGKINAPFLQMFICKELLGTNWSKCAYVVKTRQSNKTH